MCWNCHSWAPPDGGAAIMVGEVCRRLRLPTHRVGSKMVLLQLALASRNSWNHFRSFHHIILIHTRYCRKGVVQDTRSKPSFWEVWANLLLLSSSSRKLSDLHHRLIAGASNAGSPSGRRASRHTQTLCLRLYSVFLSRILRKCLTQTRQPVQRETVRAAHAISCSLPCVGFPRDSQPILST